MRTLYVTDLDGTLLGSDGRIDKESLRILNKLMRSGMAITYATARSPSSASAAAQGFAPNVPVIVYNGAFIYDIQGGSPLVANYFSRAEVELIQSTLLNEGLSPLVYAFVNGTEHVTRLAGRDNAGIMEYVAARPNDGRFRIVDDIDSLYAGDAFYFTCIGDRGDLVGAHQKISEFGLFTCLLQRELKSDHSWFEIMPRAATKANAIGVLKEWLGFDRIVSFGDALNDMAMFSVSDECYAVENAAYELKVAATAVIGSNDSGAVARRLHALHYGRDC